MRCKIVTPFWYSTEFPFILCCTLYCCSCCLLSLLLLLLLLLAACCCLLFATFINYLLQLILHSQHFNVSDRREWKPYSYIRHPKHPAPTRTQCQLVGKQRHSADIVPRIHCRKFRSWHLSRCTLCQLWGEREKERARVRECQNLGLMCGVGEQI